MKGSRPSSTSSSLLSSQRSIHQTGNVGKTSNQEPSLKITDGFAWTKDMQREIENALETTTVSRLDRRRSASDSMQATIPSRASKGNHVQKLEQDLFNFDKDGDNDDEESDDQTETTWHDMSHHGGAAQGRRHSGPPSKLGMSHEQPDMWRDGMDDATSLAEMRRLHAEKIKALLRSNDLLKREVVRVCIPPLNFFPVSYSNRYW